MNATDINELTDRIGRPCDCRAPSITGTKNGFVCLTHRLLADLIAENAALRERAVRAERDYASLHQFGLADRADAMIAHQWFADQYGTVMNGRDFAVKCPMATQENAALRARVEEAAEMLAECGTILPHSPSCQATHHADRSAGCVCVLARLTAFLAATPAS